MADTAMVNDPVLQLFDSTALMGQCWKLLARAERGASEHFMVDREALATHTNALVEAIRPAQEQPPLDNCWHRMQLHHGEELDHLATAVGAADAESRARTGLDLVLITTLFDPSGSDSARTVEALRLLTAGDLMEAERGAPQIDATGIEQLLADDNEDAPELDPADRAMLGRLAKALRRNRKRFGDSARFGNCLDELQYSAENGRVDATALIERFGPFLLQVMETPASAARGSGGDVWRALDLVGQDAFVSFQVPTARLVEGMAEPLEEVGLALGGLESQTVPATQRLLAALMTLGIIKPKHSAVLRIEHPANSDIVVELRCLGTSLAERIADHVRRTFGASSTQLPAQRTLVPLLQLASKHDAPALKIKSNFF